MDTLWLNYVGAMRTRISQDTEGVVLCFEQGPEGRIKVIYHFSIPRWVRRSSERVMLVNRTVKPKEASGVL